MDTDRIQRLIAARKSRHDARRLTAAAAERLVARATSSRRPSFGVAQKDRIIRLASEVVRGGKRKI
jgi:hypothetical protein